MREPFAGHSWLWLLALAACGGTAAPIDAMPPPVDAGPTIPDYPTRNLPHDAPYIDVNTQRLFRIDLAGGHWGVLSLTMPASASEFGIDLYSEAGELVATTNSPWSCGSGPTASANQTGFIAISGVQFPAGGAFLGVVHAGGAQYVVEWFEAGREIPFSPTGACTGPDLACEEFPTGHVAHAFDVALDEGNNYALYHSDLCGCPGVAQLQSFQFVVSSDASDPFASSADYLSVSPVCSACGSDQIGIATTAGADRMHGIVAIDTTGQGHAAVDLCFRAEARSCASPLQVCDARCLDARADVANCGASCTDCVAAAQHQVGATCVDSSCAYAACAVGYVDCDASAANGCEFLLSTCFTPQVADATCVNSACVISSCLAGYSSCDGDAANGCEYPRAICYDVVGTSTAPEELAVDTTSVYWNDTTTGGIMRAPVGGGATMTLATGATGAASFVAIDATDVYYRSSSAFLKVAKGGGAPSTVSTPPAATLVMGASHEVVMDASTLYWQCCTTLSIYSVPKAGGTAVTVVNNTSWSAYRLAVDATYAYFNYASFGAGLGRVLKAGGAPELLSPGPPPASIAVNDFAVDGTGIYYTSGGATGSVVVVPLGGGAGTPLTATTSPGDIVVDGANLYWATGTGEIIRMPRTGGTAVTLAVAQVPSHLAVDATHVYWTNTSPGSVRRVPK